MSQGEPKPVEKVRGLRKRDVIVTAPAKLFGGIAPPVEEPLVDSSDGNVRTELLRLMKLPVSELEKPIGSQTSAGAAIAKILLRKAVIAEQQNAITEVLDRIEGKATKAAANKPTNDGLNEQLDLSIQALDELAKET